MDWFLNHCDRLRNLLRKRGHSREETEDLLQEAFLRVDAYCKAGNEIRQPEAFLVRSVLNLAHDTREREHRNLYVNNTLEELWLTDPAPSAEELLIAEQQLSVLKNSLSAISPRTSDIFLMHRLEGLSYAQIAAHFSISVSAVEKHIAKAMVAISCGLIRL